MTSPIFQADPANQVPLGSDRRTMGRISPPWTSHSMRNHGSRLAGKRHGSHPRERRRELREHRQVSVKTNPVDAPDAKRQERPLVLEATKLALHGSTRAVELARALRLARDQRVQTVGLDPSGAGLALAGGAA